MVVSLDEARGSALNCFQLVDAGLSVWVASGVWLLQNGPDKGMVTVCLDVMWAACLVPPPKEGEAVVVLPCSGGDMRVHG